MLFSTNYPPCDSKEELKCQTIEEQENKISESESSGSEPEQEKNRFKNIENNFNRIEKPNGTIVILVDIKKNNDDGSTFGI